MRAAETIDVFGLDEQAETCRAKRAFTSVVYALNVAVMLSWRDGRRLAVYRCPCCGFFHHSSHMAGLDAVVCVYAPALTDRPAKRDCPSAAPC